MCTGVASIKSSGSLENKEAIMQRSVSVFSQIMHLPLASLHAFFKGNSIMRIMITLLMLETIAQQPLMRPKKSGRKQNARTEFGVAH